MKVEVNNAQQTEQVDWTKNPQLVVSTSGSIILTSVDQSKSDTSEFTGIIVKVGEKSKRILGEFDNRWHKSIFKPFYGSITLSND